MQISIRPAVEQDASRLTAIAVEAKAYWGYSPELMYTWLPQLTITAARIASSPVYVGEVDGQVAGFYSLNTAAPTWELDNLWVSPAFMRQGLGRTLLEHASALAASYGVMQITIDAEPNAEGFYLACGAHQGGVIPAPIPGQPNRQRPQMVLFYKGMALDEK